MQGAHAVFQLGKPSFKKENLLTIKMADLYSKGK